MDNHSGIESKARELLEQRVASVTELEVAVQRLGQSRAAVSAAEKGAEEAWGSATSAGWTVAELRHLGFTPPAGRSGRGRAAPRRRSPSPKTTE